MDRRGLQHLARGFAWICVRNSKDLEGLGLEIGRDRLEMVTAGAQLLEALDGKGIKLVHLGAP